MLSTARFGRVALTERALPVVCPVSYELDGESIRLVVNSPALDRAALGRHVVCFQVEDVDALGVVRSVTAIGPLELVDADDSVGEAPVRIARLGTPLISGVAFGGPPAGGVDHRRRPVVVAPARHEQES